VDFSFLYNSSIEIPNATAMRASKAIRGSSTPSSMYLRYFGLIPTIAASFAEALAFHENKLYVVQD